MNSEEKYELTTQQKAQLDKRYHDMLNGIGTSYSWKEAIAIAEQTLAERKANKAK